RWRRRLPRRETFAGSWDDVPAEHHRVVFVHDVVTVHRVSAEEVSEAEEDPDLLVALEPDDVLPGDLVGGRSGSIPGQDAEFLEMDVDRMLPVTGIVPEDPDLGGAPPRRGADLVDVEELAVDRPGAVLP